MSQQLAIAAFASILSMAALALSSGNLDRRSGGGDALIPGLVAMPAAQHPALPALFPR